MGLRISRTAALVVAVILLSVETWRRWDIFVHWAGWLDDYIAAALLLYGWYSGRRNLSNSRAYLMAAWGYCVGIAYMSFFGQLNAPPQTDPSGMSQAVVLTFKGTGLIVSAGGLALAWTAREAAQLPVGTKQ
jgi:hypothetical protein